MNETQSPTKFDPYQVMVQKKSSDTNPLVEWPENDIKRLENFCNEHGIFGFSCGNVPPIIALAMLKSKLGIVDGPLEERVPEGYSKPSYSPQNPYQKAILHG